MSQYFVEFPEEGIIYAETLDEGAIVIVWLLEWLQAEKSLEYQNLSR